MEDWRWWKWRLEVVEDEKGRLNSITSTAGQGDGEVGGL